MRHPTIPAAAAILLCTLGGVAATETPVPQITVQAQATIEAVPDRALLTIGVVGERKSAAEAAAENARQAGALVAELKASGVEPRDMQTSAVSLTPVYDDERDPNGRVGRRVLRGYAARNTLEIRLRDIGRTGALAARLIDRGANQIEGIAFDVSDRERRLEEGRLLALRDAQRRAQSYVEVLGLKLGRVLQIDPDGGERAAMPGTMAKRGMAMQAAPSVPVEPGIEPIVARVSVTYELVQP